MRSARHLLTLLVSIASAAPPAAAQQELLSLDGGSRGGAFGSAVAMLGDVNADGVPDFAVGLPLDDTVAVNAGQVRVFSGQTGGLLYVVNGAAAGDQFGTSIVGIPDTNTDGKAELLVGAPFADPNGANSGQVRLLSGANGSTLLTLNGAAAGDRFGHAVGYGGSTGIVPFQTRRLVVGAPYADHAVGGEGSVYLYTESGTLLKEWSVAAPNGHLGWSVGGGLDTDGDNIPDVVAGAPDSDLGSTDAGLVSVYSGAAPYAALFTIAGNGANQHCGFAVALLLDANQDGNADVVFSSPGEQSDKGAIRVYNVVTSTNISYKSGTSAGDLFGFSVASAGDVNGDGKGDVIVGSPEALSGSGLGVVVSGANGGTIQNVVASVGSKMGTSVSGGYDVTGDGRPDVLGGAPEFSALGPEQGQIRLMDVVGHAFVHSLDGPTNGDQFGHAACALGDVNGDGKADFLVGAPGGDHTYLFLGFFVTDEDSGSVRCISGADGSTLWTIYGAEGDEIGFSLANLGDVNGDGKADFAVGAVQRRTATAQPGYVRIASGANGAAIATIAGLATDAELGYSLAAIPDLNGDGKPELIAGAPGYSNDLGRALRINSGTWTSPFSWLGIGATERFGTSVAAIADVNGDGKADVIVGAPDHDSVATNAGRVYGRSGVANVNLFTLSGTTASDRFGTAVAPLSLAGTPAFAVGAPGADFLGTPDMGFVRIYLAATQTVHTTVFGATSYAYFGSSISNLGDYAGTGYDALACGALENFLFGMGQGQARVLTGFDGSAQFVFDGAATGDQFGKGVAAAGDVNADGTIDLLVGAPFADPSGTSSGNLKVLSLVPQGVAYYGSGTPGCNGTQKLRVSAPPKVGMASLAYGVENVPAGALGLLLVTDSQDFAGSDPFAIGVKLHVDFFAATQVYGIDINGTANGHGFAVTPIGNDPQLAGLHFYVQSVWSWVSCSLPPFNLSSSTAAEVVIQP